MATAQQIKLIHTIKGALKLDDDTYRAVLQGYGVESSKSLPAKAAEQLITELKEKAVAAGVWARRGGYKQSKKRLGSDPQAAMIVGLWSDLHKAGLVRSGSVRSLSAYIKRMTKKDALRWCSSYEKSRLIEALKSWLERAA